MSAAAMMDDDAPTFDLTLATRLLPGAVSAFSVLMAVVVLEHLRRGMDLLVPMLYIQATLLAVGAAALAAAASERLSRWEARVAPQSAHGRVRARLLGDLWRMAALGLAGPLVLAMAAGWQAGGVQPLLGTLAVLGASLCGGFGAVHSWQGRAPRWVLPVALAALGGLLAVPGALASIGDGGPGAMLVLAATAWGVWYGLLARHALAARAPAWPLPSLRPRWRRTWSHRGWEVVRYKAPYNTLGGQAHRPKPNLLVIVFMWMPQFVVQSEHLAWLGWGQVYSRWYQAAGHAVWMLLIAAFASGYLVAPRLHWRRRLAPRGLTPQRWARRLVLGSMLGCAVAMSLGIGLSVAVNAMASRPLHADAWLTALVDVLLASSFATWQRGRYENGVAGFVWTMGFVLAVFALLAALPVLGVAPQRGALWLTIQLALTVGLARSAIEAWSRRDLNSMI